MDTDDKAPKTRSKQQVTLSRREALKGLAAAAATTVAAGLAGPAATATTAAIPTTGIAGAGPRRGALAGFKPTPSMRNASHYYPGTETLGKDEMRVTYMGSSPVPRANQSGTSIFVELGNGDSFIFDMGPGCIRNYTGLGVPFAKINNVFLTHLHVDHWGDIPYVTMFGANYNRVDPLRVYGPSGRTKELGTAAWAEHLNKAMEWHRHSFGQFPTWPGLHIEAHEFDWTKKPGVVYEKNGVKIISWPIPHSVDGSVSFRLDWNGLSFVWTGDGRPSKYTIEFGKGADMLATECAVANIDVMHTIFGAQSPETLAYILDVPHTPAYAAGYMFKEAKPRVGIVTHESFDHLTLAELVDEIRYHWDGPIGLGMPDRVVFNITKDAIWEREGVIPVSGGIPPYKPTPEDLSKLRYPKYILKEEQSQWVTDLGLDPKLYYPPEMVHPIPDGPPAEWLKLPKAK